MNHAFILLWTVLIFASIAWYGFLVFYVGFKGGQEILTMIRHLENRPDSDAPPRH